MAKLQARIILEILGRPPEHVREALEQLVTKLGKEPGVSIKEQTLHEPLAVKDSKNLYTTFAELVLDLDSYNSLFSVMFGYMPAHVEVITPEFIDFPNAEMSSMLNSLLQRLHNYDAIAKRLVVENENLLQKLFEVAPSIFKPAKDSLNTPNASNEEQKPVVSPAKKDSKKSKKSSKKN